MNQTQLMKVHDHHDEADCNASVTTVLYQVCLFIHFLYRRNESSENWNFNQNFVYLFLDFYAYNLCEKLTQEKLLLTRTQHLKMAPAEVICFGLFYQESSDMSI